jgi:large subunit ribosomal protein L10e
MAGRLRPGRSYRHLEMPYTRKSKYKSRNYVKMSQDTKITQFNSGNLSSNFERKILILSERGLQLRDNAIEAARVVANKHLTDTIGDQNFRLVVIAYPHQVLREHKLATGAGADRFSSGMQKSFGKPTGLAARISAGGRIFEIHVMNEHLNEAKIAAQKIGKKLGIRTKSVAL